MIKELELYKSYFYKDLEEWFCNKKDIDPNMTWDELGEGNVIGCNFIVIQEGSMTYSFVMDGYNSKHGSSFKLIFNE
jgi:hypothetical protein